MNINTPKSNQRPNVPQFERFDFPEENQIIVARKKRNNRYLNNFVVIDTSDGSFRFLKRTLVEDTTVSASTEDEAVDTACTILLQSE